MVLSGAEVAEVYVLKKLNEKKFETQREEEKKTMKPKEGKRWSVFIIPTKCISKFCILPRNP